MQEPLLEYTLWSKPPKDCGYIYEIVSPSCKRYVGKCVSSVAARYASHVYSARKNGRSAVHCAIRKYGEAAMRVNVIALCPSFCLSDVEQECIKRYNTRAPNGYNLTDGGDGALGVAKTEQTRLLVSKRMTGRVFTKEHRQHMVDARKRETPEARALRAARISMALTGKKHGPVTRLHMSMAKKQALTETERLRLAEMSRTRPLISDETRAKMSISQRKRPPKSMDTRLRTSASLKGHPVSPETREKIRRGNVLFWQRKRKGTVK